MLVCIDFDGVVMDSVNQQLDIVLRAQRTLAQGRVPTLHDFSVVESLTPIGFAKHIGIPEAFHPEWCELAIEGMSNTTYPATIFPDAPSMLTRLATRHCVVVVSSNVRETIEFSLEAHGLVSCVRGIYDCRMEGTKTDKIRFADRDFGFIAADTVMIGDTRSDIRHAKEAGVRAIAVSWGYQSEETLAKERPDFIASDADSLLRYLDV